jgi:hypothetical protein
MPRFPFVPFVTALASLGLLTGACAERAKSEEAPAPNAPVETATAATINASASVFNGLRLQKLTDLRRPHLVRPPSSVVEQPVVAAVPDASAK